MASVNVTPLSAPVGVGTGLQLTAVATDARGTPLNGRVIVWASSDSAVATVSAGGLVTGVSLGAASITATSEGESGSASITVTPGPATQLAFTSQPGTLTAGVPIAPALQVTARDVGGNTAIGFSGKVTVAIATNPGGAALSGTTTVDAVAGVATFSDLSLDKSGTGYTLQASSGSLATGTSVALTVVPAQAVGLAFAVQPSAATAGAALVPAVQVVAQDAFANTVPSFGDTVTVALVANPNGGTLSGTRRVLAVNGTASFADLSLDRAGSGYALAAATPSLSSGTSAQFTVAPGAVSASQSMLSVSPNVITSSSGTSVSTITVAVRDALGNTIPGVTVAVAVTGTGNTLTRPTQPTAANGIATGTLSSTVAESKMVSATAGGVALTQTATVTVNPAGAGTLAFTVQPTDVVAGAAIAPAVQVTARDAFGNVSTGFTGTVTVAIGNNSNGGTLTGTLSRPAVAGVATFNDLKVDKAGPGYTLTAAASGLAGTTSTAFKVDAGAVSASQSRVAVAPATITASSGSSATTITVTARDAFSNPVPGTTVTVLATGQGNTLVQPAGPTDASGVATGTLSSTGAGAKTVSATVNGVTVAQQPSVTVVSGTVLATQSTLVASPTDVEASNGGSVSTLRVTAKDAFGNPVSSVTVALSATGSGNTLTQPAGTTNASGVASGTLSSTTIGVKVVSATVNGTLIPQTASVTVDPGEVSATLSTVVASPSTITASSGSSVSTITVTAKDVQGNPIPNATIVLAATGSANTLVQPAGRADSNGVAMGTLRSTVAENKLVSVTIDGTGIENTDTVTVTPAAASGLGFVVQPTSTTVETTLSPAVKVEVRDAFGNHVTTATTSIALAFGANPGGATLSGGAPVAALNGVATFSSLSVDRVGTGYTLSASATGLPNALSATFNVSAGMVSASPSTVAASPTSITAGSGTATITVTAKDASGNPVSGATVVLSATGSGNTITQPSALTNASGVTTGTIASTGAGTKTVTATANAVTLTQKPSVTVTPAPVSASVSTIGASPASIVAGGGTSTITVTVKDAFSNPISGATVTLAATGSGNTMTQPSTATNSSGAATGSLASTSAGTKTVTATADGVALSQTVSVMVTTAGSTVTFVGAGDIADCGNNNDQATADLINAIPGSVFALGDNVYDNGTVSEFVNCYGPTWGAFKSRTFPSAGNHEYNTSGASGYFSYFGSAAGTPGLGYYSFDLGAWHIVVLNSNISTAAGSAQELWLKADLAAHQNLCTLAYWHHPLYSSIDGPAGTTGATLASLRPLWDDLYAAGAELVLAGHRHDYERFAPMKPDGSPDPVAGIREIIAGTGGVGGGDFTNIFPTSQVREGRTFGVLKLTLSASSYTWQFIPVAGSTFTDSGSGTCH